MSSSLWHKFPRCVRHPKAYAWLQLQNVFGLAPNTIEAYARALEEFFTFCASFNIDPSCAKRGHVVGFVRELSERPSKSGRGDDAIGSDPRLSNATLQQRITALRLFFDYLTEEGVRWDNPVSRGRYTPGKCFGGRRTRTLVPRFTKLSWIPSDDEWKKVLEAVVCEPARNRLMLAFAYDAALRREELCSLRTDDLDPSRRLLRIRAETTKSRMDRVVPYSAATSDLFCLYLAERRQVSRARGPLFLSESRRNRSQPVTLWTWSKVVRRIAKRARLPRFSTHTLRHLCLTDLARSGWDVHEIAKLAGHRSIQTTLRYIHLSGRELSEKVAKGMAAIHQARVAQLADPVEAQHERGPIQ